MLAGLLYLHLLLLVFSQLVATVLYTGDSSLGYQRWMESIVLN